MHYSNGAFLRRAHMQFSRVTLKCAFVSSKVMDAWGSIEIHVQNDGRCHLEKISDDRGTEPKFTYIFTIIVSGGILKFVKLFFDS